ncbi:hypothetical protein PsorP6_003635 [Peronosclerospora sorghi]|uniref:Uncharacterized protein n=1 Tax=Peronosclerospora sorghi TaxID=230839 RepID=A0ACC0VS59_9STRA|nr:hypothetical protein PsorP6_003635 [Peronosclerospora sorghi]
MAVDLWVGKGTGKLQKVVPLGSSGFPLLSRARWSDHFRARDSLLLPLWRLSSQRAITSNCSYSRKDEQRPVDSPDKRRYQDWLPSVVPTEIASTITCYIVGKGEAAQVV